jgi:dihydrodipicolinate synthase/N-acetylneuraminate lyase
LHGVIIYNRAHSRLNAREQLSDKCSNLIGFKDGVGDIESMGALYSRDIMALSRTAKPADAAPRRVRYVIA